MVWEAHPAQCKAQAYWRRGACPHPPPKENELSGIESETTFN